MKSEKIKEAEAYRKKLIERISHKWALQKALNPEMGLEWTIQRALNEYDMKFKKELNKIADNKLKKEKTVWSEKDGSTDFALSAC